MPPWPARLDGLIDRLLDVANARHGDGYLFGGSRRDRPPYYVAAFDSRGRPNAIAYAGADQPARLALPGNVRVDVLRPGKELFVTPAGDVFALLCGLRDDLRKPGASADDWARDVARRQAKVEMARDEILRRGADLAASTDDLDALANRAECMRKVAKRADRQAAAEACRAEARECDELYAAAAAASAKVFDNRLLAFIR